MISPKNQEKGGLHGRLKAHPNKKLHGLILPVKILIAHPEFILIDITINFKLIFLTLLFKSLFFKTTAAFLLLDMFSIIMQWVFCKYVLSKKIKTDIFNKSAFLYRKLILIV